MPANGISIDGDLRRVLPTSTHCEPGSAPSGSAVRIRTSAVAEQQREQHPGQPPRHAAVSQMRHAQCT